MVRAAERVTIFRDPQGETKTKGNKLAPRLSTLDGKVMGIVDDGGQFVGDCCDGLAEELRKRFEIAGEVKKIKRSMSSPLAPNLFQEMLGKVDFVIVGVGL